MFESVYSKDVLWNPKGSIWEPCSKVQLCGSLGSGSSLQFCLLTSHMLSPWPQALQDLPVFISRCWIAFRMTNSEIPDKCLGILDSHP